MQASSLLGQAQKQAEQEGRIFIFNVEESLVPKAGEHLPDGALSACIDYITGFSQNLVPLIKEMTCPNKSSVGARLRNGVSLSLGAPKDASDISLKESVILALLKEHEHEITYINVRVPNQPAWRGLGSTGAANVKQETENAKQNSAEQTGGNQAGASNFRLQ